MNKIRMIALAACMAATLDASAQEQEIRLFSHRGGRMEHEELRSLSFPLINKLFNTLIK